LARSDQVRSGSRKFSLAGNDVLATPSRKVINGMEDSIFPIEDSTMAATQGQEKALVALNDRRHMGNPGAEDIVYEWLDKALAGQPLSPNQPQGSRPRCGPGTPRAIWQRQPGSSSRPRCG
jgi:hypothetical protein